MTATHMTYAVFETTIGVHNKNHKKGSSRYFQSFSSPSFPVASYWKYYYNPIPWQCTLFDDYFYSYIAFRSLYIVPITCVLYISHILLWPHQPRASPTRLLPAYDTCVSLARYHLVLFQMPHCFI
eukprot:215661_1